MSTRTIVAASIVAAVIVIVVTVIAVFFILEIRRRFARFNAERAAVKRRIEEVRCEVRSGVRHGTPFTLDPANPPHGKATHVSSTGERSENHG